MVQKTPQSISTHTITGKTIKYFLTLSNKVCIKKKIVQNYSNVKLRGQKHYQCPRFLHLKEISKWISWKMHCAIKERWKPTKQKLSFPTRLRECYSPNPRFDSQFNSMSKVHQPLPLSWLLSIHDYWQLFQWKVNPPLSLSLPGAGKLYTKEGKYSLWSH